MTEELLRKLEEETLRELDYAEKLKTLESDAYEQIMEQVRENCKLLNETEKEADAEYNALEDMKFKKEAKASDYVEHRKDRWVNAAIGAAGIVIPLVAYGFMFKLGLTFEEEGTITSQFFKNLLNRFKPT